MSAKVAGSGFNVVKGLRSAPAMSIGEHVRVKGDLRFDSSLRIDGTVEGHIYGPSSASLVIGPTGTVKGNIVKIREVIVEGKLRGNVNAETVIFSGLAAVHGEVTARAFAMDPSVVFVGKINVSYEEPFPRIDADGRILNAGEEGSEAVDQVEDIEVVDNSESPTREAVETKNDTEIYNIIPAIERTEEVTDSHANSAREHEEDVYEDDHEPIESEADTVPLPALTVASPAAVHPMVSSLDTAVSSSKKFKLVILDPQKDFFPGGSAPARNSSVVEDAHRLAALIRRYISNITAIFISRDSHPGNHISFPSFWTSSSGVSPEPDAVISLADLQSGIWLPRDAALLPACLEYFEEIEKGNEPTFVVKAPHCIEGSSGEEVVDVISEAVALWAETSKTPAIEARKGRARLVDTHSAFRVDNSPNHSLLVQITSDEAVVMSACGCNEACLVQSLEDMLSILPEDGPKISLIRDCCSSATGLAADAEEFFTQMASSGIEAISSTEITNIS